MKANFNINLTTLILIILIVLGIGYYRNTVNDLKNQVTEEVKLSNALLDTTRTYRNKNNELVSEKLTLQASLERLKDENLNLSESQRELLRRIDEMGREKEVIAAALIKTEIRLDSLLNIGGVVDTTAKKVDFYENSDTLIYHISVRDVLPAFQDKRPSLLFETFFIPNESFIEFHWNTNRRENYPIGFSVTNTNPLFETVNIDSYAIPELQKQELTPTTWNKIVDFLKTNGKYIGAFGIGVAAGSVIF